MISRTRGKRPGNPPLIRDSASSEMISSLALIFVLVGVTAVILSFVTQAYPKDELPYADISIENISDNGHNYAVFYHRGGENFTPDSIRVKVIRDGSVEGLYSINSSPTPLTLITTNGTPVSWNTLRNDYSYGYGLRVPKLQNSGNYSYQILYNQGIGDYVYRQFGKGTGGDISIKPTPPAPGVCDEDGDFITTNIFGTTYRLISPYSGAQYEHSWIISSNNGYFNSQIQNSNDVQIALPGNPTSTIESYVVQHKMTNTETTCTNSQSHILQVQGCSDTCSPDFAYRTAGMTGHFFDQSSSTNAITKWNWSFGDGDTSDLANPSHPFSGGPSFPVSLRIESSVCGQTINKSVEKRITLGCSGNTGFRYRYEEPSSNPWNVIFEYPSDATDRANFKNSSTLIWDYGDGHKDTIKGTDWASSSTGGHNYQTYHLYEQCKDYSVTLQIIDPDCGSFSSIKTIQLPCTCSNPPTSNFTSHNVQTGTPFDIEVTDLSAGHGKDIIRWEWDMGNGDSFVNTTAPGTFSYRYTTCGKYPIHLIVYNTLGCFGESIREVSCGGDSCSPGTPTADFSASQNLNNPGSFTFTDLSTPADSIDRWQWDFGDGSRSSVKNPPEHTYTSCTNNTVQLRVWDKNGCWDDAIQDVSCLCPNPDAKINIIQDSLNPKKFTFLDLSTLPSNHLNNAEYYWEFGDGTSSAQRNPPAHEYAICGQYTVRLKVTTDCGSSDDAIQDAVCGCPAPSPEFSYHCIGEKIVNFTDISKSSQPIESWLWEFGDNTNFGGQNPPKHEYSRSGTYQVNLSITTACKSVSTWSRYVTVPCCEFPTAGFDYFCKSDGKTISFHDTTKGYGYPVTSWNWNFGDGTSSNDQNPEHIYPSDGIWPVTLTSGTGCGGKGQYFRNISVPCFCSPPQTNYSTEAISDSPFTVRFHDLSLPVQGSITSWNWSFGDGTSSSLQIPPDHQYSGCGEYLTRLTVENNCGSRDDLESLVCCPVNASFSFQMDQPDGRAPVNVSFLDQTSGIPTAWYWNFGDGGFSNERNPVHTFTKGGNYTVTLHATNTCGGDEVSDKIVVVTCPSVSAVFDYTIVSEDPLTIQFTDRSTGYDISGWTWYFGDGSSSSERNPVHSYLTRDDYEVILTVKNSCGSESTISQYLPVGCPPLTITAKAGPGGYIDPEGYIQVPCGWSKTFNVTADLCHTISDININGYNHLGPQPSPFVYTFTDVQANESIEAFFSIKNYTVVSSAGAGGRIDPSGSIKATCGSNLNFTITADHCYNISSVLINGTNIGPQISPFTYTFTNITSDQSIHADFGEIQYIINTSVTPQASGSLTPTGPVTVRCGQNQTFTTTANPCYNITDIIVDGTHLGSQGSPFQYTFTNVQSNHDIQAVLSLKYYLMTSSAGAGGNISPLGIVSVPCGGNQIYNITPLPCYRIQNVSVDGIFQGPVAQFVFSGVSGPHTINATFEQIPYIITSSANAGGIITPLGNTVVLCGQNQSYNIVANSCFNISNIILNGVSLGPQSSPYQYTFTNVTASQTIQAVFIQRSYSINSTAGTGGIISPSGITTVPCGLNQSYTISSNPCYNISNLIVDGVSGGGKTSPYVYNFTDVQANHTIQSLFALQGPYTIISNGSVLNPDGSLTTVTGKISPEGTVSLACGSSQLYTMISSYTSGNTLYSLAEVRIDGVPVGVTSTYTFSNVQGNHIIQAIYTPSCQIITGIIVNATNAPIGGLRVELWNQARTIMLRYTISKSDGTYKLPAPVNNNDWFDVYLPNVVTVPTWTTNGYHYYYSNQNIGNFTGQWADDIQLNQASKCSPFVDWTGIGVSR